MGCCFSSANQNPDDQNCLKNQQPQFRSPVPKSNPTHEDEADPRAPPQPPVEEESVKEVLSETPISKPQVPILVAERKTQMPSIQHQAENEEFETKGPINKAEEVSEVSQLSKICSISDSISTATTATTATIPERSEDEATSKRSSREGNQKWNRSPSDASRKRPYTVDSNSTGVRERRAKSPARRSEPSPEKKSQGRPRSVRGRESDQVASWKLNARSPSPGVRRDPGEGFGRLSRSPSSTRTVSGVGKVRAGSGRSQLKPPGGAGRQLPKGVERENGGSEKVGEKNDDVPQEESLENPHVSLECFIFL